MKILLGIIITYSLQYSLSIAYTHRWEKLFDETCHYTKVGENLEVRIDCVYKNMPKLKLLGDIFLSRPVVVDMHYNTPTYDFRW